MKKNEVIKYLKNKIKLYSKKYGESGDNEYIYAQSYIENAITTLKEVE